jgi:hypothetical protein
MVCMFFRQTTEIDYSTLYLLELYYTHSKYTQGACRKYNDKGRLIKDEI